VSDKSNIKVLGFDSSGQEIIPKSNKTILSVYTNRHTTTDGHKWGWIEGCTKNICWRNNSRFTKEDALNLIKVWNEKIGGTNRKGEMMGDDNYKALKARCSLLSLEVKIDKLRGE